MKKSTGFSIASFILLIAGAVLEFVSNQEKNKELEEDYEKKIVADVEGKEEETAD